MPPLPRPLRIAIVNDYEVIVSGIATMLAPFRDRVRVVELDNRVPVASDVDVVLFDTFGHVGRGGVDLHDVVCQRGRGPKVVVFSWTCDRAAVEPALALGAAGYLSKTMSAHDLVTALEDIHAGVVVTSEAHGVLHDESSGDWPAHEFELSPREAEVLALIAKGLSNQEIADLVFLSVNSIKTYVRTAYNKIGVHSRSQAVMWAHDHGFAPRSARHVVAE